MTSLIRYVSSPLCAIFTSSFAFSARRSPARRVAGFAAQCDPDGRNFISKRVPGKAKNRLVETRAVWPGSWRLSASSEDMVANDLRLAFHK